MKYNIKCEKINGAFFILFRPPNVGLFLGYFTT